VRDFQCFYSRLQSTRYDPDSLDLDASLDGADVVMVHEWNPARFIERVGLHRRSKGRYRLLFHDTHHRVVSGPRTMGAEHLRHYDDILVFGESLRKKYLEQGWSTRVFVWHEAADTRVFTPWPRSTHSGDLVWIGNWGDDERTAELEEFLLRPVRALKLLARIHGVRYPHAALAALAESGIEYAGWLPNFRVPQVFGNYQFTIHVPRRPYREQLPGVPTIRVFEALACGIPLICAPWDDCEGLFTPGKDYLVARNGDEMICMVRELLNNARLRHELSEHGLNTIRARHSCSHRTDQLLEMIRT
jgi:spore maturation protein CgeB